MSNVLPVEYDFTENHEHPEGGDRGGYAPETHTFRVHQNGLVEHDYSLDCSDGGPGGFGLDNDTLSRLGTREEALGFVEQEIESFRAKLAYAEDCKAKLLAANEYKDVADYWGYEKDEDDEAEEVS